MTSLKMRLLLYQEMSFTNLTREWIRPENMPQPESLALLCFLGKGIVPRTWGVMKSMVDGSTSPPGSPFLERQPSLSPTLPSRYPPNYIPSLPRFSGPHYCPTWLCLCSSLPGAFCPTPGCPNSFCSVAVSSKESALSLKTISSHSPSEYCFLLFYVIIC